jgi:hypothetical protein
MTTYEDVAVKNKSRLLAPVATNKVSMQVSTEQPFFAGQNADICAIQPLRCFLSTTVSFYFLLVLLLVSC